MMLNLAESSHPIFRATGALEKGDLRSKKKRERSLFTLTVAKKPPNLFFARLFL